MGTTMENRTPASVDGPRYGSTKPVFVLIDRRSASGAESLAYHLQALRRVTVVGEQSLGAANPGGLVRLPNDFLVFIPTGRVKNAVTGGNWEGTGVTPNIRSDGAGALEAALKAARSAIGR
jgi:C-terminal processing protease CtpA/Prc